MNKIYYRLLFIIVLSFCAVIHVFSKESGWEQRAGYKYQKLSTDSLLSLQPSVSGDSLFTYHSSGKIMIWNLQSGELLDSIAFNPKPNLLQFSRDMKTAVLAYGGVDRFHDTIKIYEIASRKIIGKSVVDFMKIFPFKSTITVYYNREGSSFNYISNKNELYIRIFCEGSGHYYYAPESKTLLMSERTGYMGVMEISNDALIKKKQISDVRVLDYLHYNDTTLLFSTDYFKFIEPAAFSQSPPVYEGTNKLNKMNLVTGNSSTGVTVVKHFEQTPDMTRLIMTSRKDSLLYRNNKKYHDYSVSRNSQNNPYLIEFPNTKGNEVKAVEDAYKTKDILVIYQDTNFYFVKLKNRTFLKTIASPVKVDSFFIFNDDKTLIAYNIKGEVVVLDIVSVTDVTEDNMPVIQENLTYPNPVSGIFTLGYSLFHDGNIKVDITDIVGNNSRILYDGLFNKQDLQFDISDMPNGTYIITARQNDKIHTFKVVKGQ